jgi:hypothetical protein
MLSAMATGTKTGNLPILLAAAALAGGALLLFAQQVTANTGPPLASPSPAKQTAVVSAPKDPATCCKTLDDEGQQALPPIVRSSH